MSLERYRRKRDFARTPEPRGELPDSSGATPEPEGAEPDSSGATPEPRGELPDSSGATPEPEGAEPGSSGATPGLAGDEGTRGRPPGPGHRFVVQRHRARRLHYDVRFEIDGVLMSWAVPKGPTLDPSVRRMAVHVEDHPLEYFDFEGVIPEHQYGAGDVIVWDWGTFEPEETVDPGRAVRDGELKFRLHGEKLHGRFTLVRTAGRLGDRDADRSWLLIKKRDEAAVPGWDPEAHPRSVKTGRTNDEVAAGRDAAWMSGAPAAEAAVDLAAARETPMPDFIDPMKATLTDRPFTDADWLFEVKWDGYRVEAVVRGGAVRLWTRHRQDAARYFPALTVAPTWIDAREAIVDGEVVALRPDGTADFSLLQDVTGVKGPGSGRLGGTGVPREERFRIPLAYEVFDLLYLDGRSLLDVPLEDRKRLLRGVLRDHPLVRYAGHVEADGEAFFRVATERGVEGMVAKLRASRYEPGRRSRSWLKIKVRPEQELVVGGYVPGKGRAADLGALVVGVHDDGQLRYAGKVGSGFDEATRAGLLARLEPLRRPDPPFANPPRMPEARWTEPRLVIRVEFAEWTTDGLVRQAAYKGLEPEKDAASVIRERPEHAARAAAEREEGARARDGERTSAAARATGGEETSAAARARDGEQTSAAARSRDGSGSQAAGHGRIRGGDARDGTHDDRRRGGSAPPPTPDELTALDAMPAKGGTWHIAGREVSLTNLDRMLFPAAGLTKRDVIRYYVTVAPTLLPYLEGRALNLWRWPEGVEGPHFWQKELPGWAPAWIARRFISGSSRDESHTYVVADGVATLAWLANQAAFEIHPWTSLADAPERPTYALVDIDPGERTTWDETLVLARLYREALRHLGVRGYPKTTGKRGIQVWIPVVPRYSFDETRTWVEGISRAIGATVPDLVSWEWERAARRGRARLDYTQNAVNKTLVGPYVVRAQPRATVSTPIDWDELEDPELRPDRWTIETMGERLERRGDLFRGALDRTQELPPLG